MVVIGLIVFFSLFSILWITKSRSRHSAQAKSAVIYQQHRVLEEIDLGKDGIINILGGRMQIEVKGRRLRVLNSDCPHHICMNMGWIQYGGQTIVCVPNQVLVEIKSTGPALLDAVVY